VRPRWLEATAKEEVSEWRVKYSVEVGRWEGIFSFSHYADIFTRGVYEDEPLLSVNAFTKRGAIKRALREIRKIEPPTSDTVVIYDVDNDVTQTIEVT